MKPIVTLMILMIIGMPLKVNGAAKILLVPLDSRPFCTKSVADLARIASTEILMPPHELSDFFMIAGEVEGLRRWTLEHINEVDAAILSIDQLMSGGLIASREKIVDDAAIDLLAEFLIELRARAPTKKIYAFNILPRHLPPRSIENYRQRRALIKYSELLGRGSGEFEALLELDRFVSAENKKLYFDRFEQSEKVNRRLIALTESGVLDRLVIGSDDSTRYSIQNVLWARLSRVIDGERVTMTHGADELAMTILARHLTGGREFRVRVEYNERSTGYRVMPFMSATVGEVVVEKVRLMGGRIVESGEDFVLLVSVNGEDKKTRRARRALADEIDAKIERRSRIALVDLSVHFDRSETLMPVLIERGVAVNGLTAYSSFNTASNSIGCVLSTAAITMSALEGASVASEREAIYRSSVEYLTARIVEDELYSKEAIDMVNGAMRRLGREPAWLDAGGEYELATFLLRLSMWRRVWWYGRTDAFRRAVEFDGLELRAEGLEIEVRYPWYRTFEIELNCDVDLKILSRPLS